MRYKLWYVFILVAGHGFCSEQPAALEKSVVQIFCFSQQPVWTAPWKFYAVQQMTGTGFVISGKRIMTNAHVVSWAKEILVKRYEDPRPYVAKVKFIGHDCDLAILEVEAPGFFDRLEPLSFGHLPKVRSAVFTYGYPAGGDQISYTRGVVSRIEQQTYAHIENRAFLTGQTDAAINPGNSGGPVIQDDRVVGVAFQAISGLQNTGFFIPPPIIEHFLKDIEDGVYSGFPYLGIHLVPLENPAYRRFLKLPDDGVGARVEKLLNATPAQKLLQEDDVILQAGDYGVGSDGSILYEGNRVSAGAAFLEKQHGENFSLKVWREGHEMTISLPLTSYEGDRAQGNQYDALPQYYVHAGLVFIPLSTDYLRTFGDKWREQPNLSMLYDQLERQSHEDRSKSRKQPILLASILPHAVNADIKIRGCTLIEKINGVTIDNLKDVIRAFELQKGRYHTIEFLPHHELEILGRDEAERANPGILKSYNIPNDRRL